MNILIEDKKIQGFNDPAKAELDKSAKTFVDDVIEESYRIESTQNPHSKSTQVTSGMVLDANTSVRRIKGRVKKSNWGKAIEVFKTILLVVAGAMWDLNKFKTDTWYLIIYFVIALITVAVVVFSAFKE